MVLTFDKETFSEKDGQVYLRDLSGKGNDGKVVGATFEVGRRGQAVAFIAFRKSNVKTAQSNGDGSSEARMRERSLSCERRTRRVLA